MKKLFLTLVLALLCAGSLFAGTVPVETAQTVALNFFKANAPDAANNSSLVANLAYTKAEADGMVDFYVFDVTPGKGFVIVSANDVMEPVIGYSSESNFHAEVAGNIGVSDWMNNAAAKITTASRMGLTADESITRLWAVYSKPFTIPQTRGTTVSPLLTTTWNQEPYYNQYCPFNSADNQRCVTGCVATAMAQILKFWNYPAVGKGSHSYTDAPPGYSYNYGAQTANFAATTYNWANMPNSINANNADIGTLMYQCGVSVNMDYGDDNQGGSGAAVIGGNPSAQYSYVNYFSYNSSTIKGVNQSSYTAATWITLLQGELNAGRPIQYMGFESSGGGHTWVCDGYDANSLFHMNWGWGGYDNGYFSLTNLNPNPYVFNSNDAALIGIQPATIATTCNVPAGLSTTNVTTTTATLNWAAVAGATGYKIQYRKVGTTTWTSASVTTANYSATGLTSSTNYEWQVSTTCSATSSSAFTSSATFTTTASPTCGIPVGLAISSLATTSVTLSWTSTGATSYNLQWKTSAGTTWTTVSGLKTTSYSLTGLTSCVAYQFQVQGNCSGTTSAYSTATGFTTVCPSCTVPTNLATSNITTTSASFGWSTVSGATGYKVQYRKVGTTIWTSATVSSAGYNASGLTASTNYEWQATTVCSASSSSAFSSSSTFTTAAVPVCSVPSALTAGSIANTSVILSWASTGAVSYNLQWKLSSAGTWTTVSAIKTNSYSLTGLTACSSYQFQVASNCSGSSSAYSAATSFSTIGCVSSYCSSRGVYTNYEFINKVVIGTINNTSGDNKGYADFTAQSTNLTGGSVATISLTPGYHGSAYAEYFTVYIDFNHNGSFTDATDKVVTVSGSATVSKTFTVPTTALNGPTRMRIQMQYGGYQTNPCANNFSYGEVEDYTVVITGNAKLVLENPEATINNATTTEPFVLYPNPAQDNVTLQITSAGTGNLKVNVFNLLGQQMIYTEMPVAEGANTLNVNTTLLGKGVYLMETDNNGIIQRQKFIIAR